MVRFQSSLIFFSIRYTCPSPDSYEQNVLLAMVHIFEENISVHFPTINLQFREKYMGLFIININIIFNLKKNILAATISSFQLGYVAQPVNSIFRTNDFTQPVFGIYPLGENLYIKQCWYTQLCC